MEFKILLRTPTVSEYNELRMLADWPVVQEHLAKKGLANSLHAVFIECEGIVAGMGRIVGDNAIYMHVQDVIVRPEFQRRGLGKLIMTELLKYVEATGGTNTNIGLMSSKGREPFYKSFGFIERPNVRYGAGMIKIKT